MLLQPAAGDKTQGTGTSIFDKGGAVGSMFNGATTFSPLNCRLQCDDILENQVLIFGFQLMALSAAPHRKLEGH